MSLRVHKVSWILLYIVDKIKLSMSDGSVNMLGVPLKYPKPSINNDCPGKDSLKERGWQTSQASENKSCH